MSGGRCRSAGNEDGSSGGKEGGAVQKTGLPTLQTTELEEQDKMPGEGGGADVGHLTFCDIFFKIHHPRNGTFGENFQILHQKV